ncbi:hypothetical protein B0H14DRAFT_3857360 [Mycena olivaceomarginata]|nr:hypothetical protein B0H14DRAFT_3857360 [Mycena olivaceomarginata]
MPPWKEDPEVASKLLKRGRLVTHAHVAPGLVGQHDTHFDYVRVDQFPYVPQVANPDSESDLTHGPSPPPTLAPGLFAAYGYDMHPSQMSAIVLAPSAKSAPLVLLRTSMLCASLQLHISSTCTMQSTVRARLRRSSDVAHASEPASIVSPDSIPHAAAFPSPHGKLTRHRSLPLFKTKIATAQCSCMIAGATKVPHGARKE